MKTKWYVAAMLPVLCAGSQLYAQNAELDRKAFETEKAKAEQGDAGAQCNLGVIYAKGNGVPQNYAEAVKWYRRAAEQDDPAAQSNLGAMYDHGDGVPQDYVEAHNCPVITHTASTA